MLRFYAAQTGKHLLRTQNVSEQNQKHFLCPQQMLRARVNGETFVSATMCPQQCVRNNVPSFARASFARAFREVRLGADDSFRTTGSRIGTVGY